MKSKHTSSLALSIGLVSALTITYQSFNTETCGLIFDTNHRTLINSLSSDLLGELKHKSSVNAGDVCVMPENKLARSLAKISQPKPDHPGQAMAFRYQEQLDESKTFNIDNWQKSQQQVKTMRNLPSHDAGLTSELWESLGPGNIGGRIRSFAFDPQNSDRIIAGSVSGGLWETTNLGQSWAPIDDFMANLSISTLIFDPNNDNVLYAGTGEGTFNADNVRGFGLFKSTDNGENWSSISATADNYDFYWVNRIVIPQDNETLYAATNSGIWQSDDGGATWSQTYLERSNDIDVDPSDNSKMVAGTWAGVLHSIDSGATWIESTGLESASGRTEVAYALSSPDTVYASIDNNSGEIYKSTDGGQSFTLINSGNSYLGDQGWYDNALWVDPTDPEHVIVGGIDLHRSTDGGQNLTKISTWWASPDSAHADHHFIMAHPDYDGVNNKQVFFANDGGMYTAPDITNVVSGWFETGWQELNNQLSITQFYGIGAAPDGTIIAGTQDNGTLVYKTDAQGNGDSEAWYETFGGDGGYSAADPTDSNYLYGEYVFLNIHRSTNGGLENSSNYIYDAQMEDGALFIAPFILDPNNPNRMLAGAGELWVSDNVKDFSPSWTSVKAKNANQASIKSIAVANGNSDLILIGHTDGEIYKSVNGNDPVPSWTQIDTLDMPERSVMRIAIDDSNHDNIFASFSGYSEGNLWKSNDGGTTWSLATGSGLTALPPAPIRTIAIHPTLSNRIYVGTEVGIFSSEDSGNNWSISNDGPANVSIDELIWQNDNTLLAATHGRGIFRATLVDDSTPDNISFTSLTDSALATQVTSETVIVTGISERVEISVANGEYSIGCTEDGFTSDTSEISAGQSVCVRHNTSEQTNTEVTTTLTVGNGSYSFSSKTFADVTPDDISISSQTETELSIDITSDTLTVSGIDIGVTLSITNGQYSLACDENAYTNSSQTVVDGQTFCVRHTSSSNYDEATSTTVTISDSEFSFNSTTRAKDETPTAISIASVSNVELSTEQTSATYSIADIDDNVSISISGGEYSLACDDVFVSAVSTVNAGDSFCVKHTSSASYSTSTTTVLTIGASSFSFISTTKAQPSNGNSGGSDSGGGGSIYWLLVLSIFKILYVRRRIEGVK